VSYHKKLAATSVLTEVAAFIYIFRTLKYESRFVSIFVKRGRAGHCDNCVLLDAPKNIKPMPPSNFNAPQKQRYAPSKQHKPQVGIQTQGIHACDTEGLVSQVKFAIELYADA
jgi:hypothetical protein